jgi:hypothetical protein
MYSSDYDTQASFYGIRKANAPVHVQMDLSDHTVEVVNTTRDSRRGLHVHVAVVSPANVMLDTKDVSTDAEADTMTPLFALPLSRLFAKSPLLFVRLELRDSNGDMIADNFYWVAKDPQSNRGLDTLPSAEIRSTVSTGPDASMASGKEKVWEVHLRNTGGAAAIALKLTLRHPDGSRILPAYYSDNYVSLLPGEERTITIQSPVDAAGAGSAQVSLRGWNLPEQTVAPNTVAQTTNFSSGAKLTSRDRNAAMDR